MLAAFHYIPFSILFHFVSFRFAHTPLRGSIAGATALFMFVSLRVFLFNFAKTIKMPSACCCCCCCCFCYGIGAGWLRLWFWLRLRYYLWLRFYVYYIRNELRIPCSLDRQRGLMCLRIKE